MRMSCIYCGQDACSPSLVSHPGSSSYISTALDDAGSVGPALNFPDILSSARLAGAADRSPIYTTNFRDGTLRDDRFLFPGEIPEFREKSLHVD